MKTDSTRLRDLLGGTDAEWMRARLRDRYERQGAMPATITLRQPTLAQRELVDRILGRAPTRSGASLVVSVARLEEILREAELCERLVDALVVLDGPLHDRRAEAETEARAWEAAQTAIASRVQGRSWLDSWLRGLVGSGVWRRAANGDPERAQSLANDALEIIDRFPLPGTALPELAARHYGDAHALDKGRDLGLLVIRAAAAYSGMQDWQKSEDRRECWASVGVLCDELSTPVLTLNLGGQGDGLSDRVLRAHRDIGEACSLSLRQLLRHPPGFGHLAGRKVFVCENPTVVAVAVERLGVDCAPLVCTGGQARTSTRVLLRALARVGASLMVQADFDIAGIHIASKSLAFEGAQPWRMSAQEYRSAKPGPSLRHARVPETLWDEQLARCMEQRGVAVHEEAILDRLLDDLGDPS